jgi:hypothetical protein
MAQLFFRLIPFLAQIVLTQGATNGYRKVSDVIYSDAISGAFGNKFCQGFQLRCMGQEDAGNLSFPQSQDFQRLGVLPVCGGVFS